MKLIVPVHLVQQAYSDFRLLDYGKRYDWRSNNWQENYCFVQAMTHREEKEIDLVISNKNEKKSYFDPLLQDTAELSIHDESWISWDNDAMPQVVFDSPIAHKTSQETNQQSQEMKELIQGFIQSIERQSNLIKDLENKIEALESKLKLKASKSEISAEVLRSTKVLHDCISSKCSMMDIQSLLERKVERHELDLHQQQTLTRDQVMSIIQEQVDVGYIHSLFDSQLREIHQIKTEFEIFVLREAERDNQIEELRETINKEKGNHERNTQLLDLKVDRDEVIMALNEQFEHVKRIRSDMESQCKDTQMSLEDMRGAIGEFRSDNMTNEIAQLRDEVQKLHNIVINGNMEKYALVEDTKVALSKKVSLNKFETLVKQIETKAEKRDVILALRKKTNTTQIEELEARISKCEFGEQNFSSLVAKIDLIEQRINEKMDTIVFDDWRSKIKGYLSLLASREELLNCIRELKPIESTTLSWRDQNNFKGRIMWTKMDTDTTNIFQLCPNNSEIRVEEAGIYEIKFGFYTCNHKAKIDLLVNGGVILSAAHPKTVQLSDHQALINDPTHPGITGLTLIDYLYLPHNCTIYLAFSGQLTPATTGFITLTRLSC